MKKLQKMLTDLQSKGYQQVSISDVLMWIRNIQSDARCKRLGLND